MEEGSLLEKALQKERQESDDPSNYGDKNAVLLDVYSLKTDLNHVQHLLSLAELAGRCNGFLQSQSYQWHYGGDGPVFGIHGSDGIPHLRAYCRYGPNVSDEYMAIDFMLQMSSTFVKEEIAISCWDVDDGQVVLIQTSEVLPEWIDEDPTDNHRYACWIHQGRIQLFQHPHISLQNALSEMQKQKDGSSSHGSIQNALEKWLEYNRKHALAMQRTPLVVPRKIAHLIRNRPDLVHAAIQEFCDNIDLPPPDLSQHEDWVWTTHKMSRTNYAMARTMVSSEWTTPELLPSVGVEVKRYKRQCAMESMPHLKYAVQLGVRLVAGIEFLSESKFQSSSLDKRVAHWCRLDKECEGGTKQSSSWILESYQQGPNHSSYNLEKVLKCPVVAEEAKNLTLHSYPDVSVKQQILNAQKGVDLDEDFPMPLPDQVDEESWLVLEGGETVQGNNLDTMLSSFQNFMVQPSGVEGVSSSQSPKVRREIRPRVFMNILHAVLRGEELSFPSKDPFFYQEDYDMMDSNEDDDESDNLQEMKGLMVSVEICLRMVVVSESMTLLLMSDCSLYSRLECYGQ